MSELSAKELEEIYTLTFKNIPDFTDNDASRILRISDELTDLISKIDGACMSPLEIWTFSIRETFQNQLSNYLKKEPNMFDRIHSLV